jgi:6-phosphofructokinase 1
VRSGQSSAFDVNFGHKAGAAAVFLLLEGKTGNTVVNVDGKTIYYMSTPEAIKRREVDISEIALFESLGTCFGRKPLKYDYHFAEVKDKITRHL